MAVRSHQGRGVRASLERDRAFRSIVTACFGVHDRGFRDRDRPFRKA
jgi:hypothetical protein